MWEVMGLNSGQVKPMHYRIDTCQYLAWFLALLESDKIGLAHYGDNMAELDIVSWNQRPSLSVRLYQHHDYSLSQVDMTLAVSRKFNFVCHVLFNPTCV